MRRRILLHRTLGGLLLLFLLLTVPALANERGVARTEFAPEPNVKRLALVIGNADYAQAGSLRNPVNDAVLMERTLQSLGFSVTALRNAEQREMERAIGEFGRRLRGGGIGLFYYAGHGMQVDGENYLLPVDANPMSESDLRYEAVPVGKLLNQMADAGNGMNLVILDACRNNPFARSFRSVSKGLAQVTAPTGTFISYATAPGSVAADGEGGNGLYTERLAAHMVTPGLSLENVFKRVRGDVMQASAGKQVPWDSSSVTGDFYFAGVSQQTTAVAAPTTPVQQTQTTKPQSSASPAAVSANPEAEKLWKRYQLAKTRKLVSILKKTSEELILKHPNSDYSIRLQAEQLQARLEQERLTPALSMDIEALRALHSRHSAVQALVASALPQLMTRAADHRQSGQLDRAASDYRLAESWGADPREIQQVMLGLKAGRVRQLIASGNFGQAEELCWIGNSRSRTPLPLQDSTTISRRQDLKSNGRLSVRKFSP